MTRTGPDPTLDELARLVRLVPLGDLTPHPDNPNEGDPLEIAVSIRRKGWYGVVNVSADGTILAGEHRWRGLQLLQDDYDAVAERLAWLDRKAQADENRKAKRAKREPKELEPMWLPPRGFIPVFTTGGGDDEHEQVLIGDNAIGRLARWNDARLWKLLERRAKRDDLPGTGFKPATFEELRARLAESQSRGDSSLLSRADVTIGDPDLEVHRHDVWHLGHHVLIVADVIREHARWSKYLTAESLFVPYPGVYLALSKRADEHPCVMVQPDPLLAAHVIAKYQAVKGKRAVKVER